MSQNDSKKYSKKRPARATPLLPIILAVAGVALVGLAFWGLRSKPAGQANIEVTGAPSLKVDKEKVDLGDVKLGQVVEVSFQLTNVGDQALRFSKAPYIEVLEGC
jgi:hypothetical protein